MPATVMIVAAEGEDGNVSVRVTVRLEPLMTDREEDTARAVADRVIRCLDNDLQGLARDTGAAFGVVREPEPGEN